MSVHKSRTGVARSARAAVAVVASALVLAACSSGGGNDVPGEDVAGVAFGATKAEYQAAFEDIDPIVIATQTAGAPGTVTSAYFEAYQEAVTDWSGGKIEFDTSYAYSVAPAPEVSDAIADGRIDMSYTIPAYQPEELPASNAMIDTSIVAEQTPLVGMLQLMGWSVETSMASDQIRAEWEEIGLYPLLPVYALGPDVFACSEPRSSLSDLNGTTARMGTRLNGEQFSALGIDGISIAVQEIYEGLQRGVIDCTTSGPLSLALMGSVEVAPHVRYSPSTGFAGGFASVVINNGIWTDLPLPAQQLLHDRLDVFVEAQLNSGFWAENDLLVFSEQYGGEVKPFDGDVLEALKKANTSIIERSKKEMPGMSDPASFVDASLSTMERWREAVVGLGYDPKIGYQQFAKWYEDKQDDTLTPFVEELFSNPAVIENRPS